MPITVVQWNNLNETHGRNLKEGFYMLSLFYLWKNLKFMCYWNSYIILEHSHFHYIK